MHIAGREIGGNQGPYVIAEIGVNHDGSIERALELVEAAAWAGADAVKVQHFRADLLLSHAAALAGYQRAAGETDPAAMLRRLELPARALSAVAGRARELGLHAIATVFSLELVGESEAVGWDSFKAASPDLVNRPLLEAMAMTGRPLILSTGAADLEEVRTALGWLAHAASGHRLAVLQCVSSYPTPMDRAALGGIAAIRALFPGPVGYSDHTESTETGALAVALGASILEKHLTHDRSAPGPDHAASLEPTGFMRYVQRARWAAGPGREEALASLRPYGAYADSVGPAEKRASAIERDVRTLSRQSVVTTRNLRPGDIIGRADVTTKRPGTGIAPQHLDRVIGSQVQAPVDADRPLTWETLRPAPAIHSVGVAAGPKIAAG